MTSQATRIVPATADHKPLIANLIQLYLYDMTESMPFPVGPDGRFEYDLFDRFWRFPYLIYSGDEIAGFAFVIDECPLTARKSCWFMAEFFVLKTYRRRGAGRAALDAILARHPGDWHIAVPQDNTPAQAFWSKALAPRTSTTNAIEFDDSDWTLNAFASSANKKARIAAGLLHALVSAYSAASGRLTMGTPLSSVSTRAPLSLVTI